MYFKTKNTLKNNFNLYYIIKKTLNLTPNYLVQSLCYELDTLI